MPKTTQDGLVENDPRTETEDSIEDLTKKKGVGRVSFDLFNSEFWREIHFDALILRSQCILARQFELRSTSRYGRTKITRLPNAT